jgi:hypothetical protein
MSSRSASLARRATTASIVWSAAVSRASEATLQPRGDYDDEEHGRYDPERERADCIGASTTATSRRHRLGNTGLAGTGSQAMRAAARDRVAGCAPGRRRSKRADASSSGLTANGEARRPSDERRKRSEGRHQPPNISSTGRVFRHLTRRSSVADRNRDAADHRVLVRRAVLGIALDGTPGDARRFCRCRPAKNCRGSSTS